MEHIAQFIEPNPLDVTDLLVVGFTGVAFVLTPAMMGMRVRGVGHKGHLKACVTDMR